MFNRRLVRCALQALLMGIAVVATLVLVSAFASRKMSNLQTWHHTPLENEFVAADLTSDYDLAQYLELEDSLFEALSHYMLETDSLNGHTPFSRFVRGGSQDPARQPRNWNRTVELIPEGVPRGGVLLLHGLSDSPYSLRSVAEFFHAQKYHVLVMRMPGHGTVPAGLLEAKWEDWAAAVKLGARHVQSKLDSSQPFYIAGYSNGGALAVHHTLTAVKNGERVPHRLFLFSPAIGITSLARAARLDMMYGFIPYFEKSKWLGIEIEYDPYKYNSFTKNAGSQSWQLAQEIQSGLDALKGSGQLHEMPPILAFQSIVDSTVEAGVLITGLFNRLESEDNEVVFFDINRSEQIDGFLSLEFAKKLDVLMELTDLKYAVTKVTNLDRQSIKMSAHSRMPGGAKLAKVPLQQEWPSQVFSLAHVAIPFPEDDPLYGAVAPDPAVFGLHIGTFNPIGEKKVLMIPPSQLIRIRHNPFHDYMMERISKKIGSSEAIGGE